MARKPCRENILTRVVLDTNVLAAGIVGTHLDWQTPPTRIQIAWLAKQFDLLISDHVLEELRRALGRPWFIARIDQLTCDRAIEQLLRSAIMIEATAVVIGIAGHAADDLVLSAAVSGHADYLVTGDAEFRQVEDYRGVRIRTPREFMIALDAATKSE